MAYQNKPKKAKNSIKSSILLILSLILFSFVLLVILYHISKNLLSILYCKFSFLVIFCISVFVLNFSISIQIFLVGGYPYHITYTLIIYESGISLLSCIKNSKPFFDLLFHKLICHCFFSCCSCFTRFTYFTCFTCTKWGFNLFQKLDILIFLN